jgi:hypothetical protein
MAKENLETRVSKAVLTIKEKIVDMYNLLSDLSLKLCHVIKSRQDYYSHSEKRDHYR